MSGTKAKKQHSQLKKALIDDVEKNAIDLAYEIQREAGLKFKTGPNGDYANSWTYERLPNGNYKVYNKDHYQLTHLLEYGHVIKNKKQGPEYGVVRGRAHIAPSTQKIAQIFEKDVIRKVNSFINELTDIRDI